jgi:serine phosphatase RsbU (regulator of sigma subunit)
MIGDVAGHGLSAAVVMNKARQAILGAAVTEVDPARILQNANHSLATRTTEMVTAACCVFDPRSMSVRYATAGHPPPIIAPTRARAYTLCNGGPPLGIIDDLGLHSSSYTFEAGSMLVLYTDGLIEEERDIVASEDRLLCSVEKSRDSIDPAACIFAAMLPGKRPRDDVAILTMRLECA